MATFHSYVKLPESRSYHIMSNNIKPYNSISYHIISYHIISINQSINLSIYLSISLYIYIYHTYIYVYIYIYSKPNMTGAMSAPTNRLSKTGQVPVWAPHPMNPAPPVKRIRLRNTGECEETRQPLNQWRIHIDYN